MTATNCNMMSYDLLFVGDIRIALRAEKKKPCAQTRAGQCFLIQF